MATIQRAVNGLVSDYSKIIYRGDNSVDCSTGKIHSHLHLASDIAEFGEPMNWEASKGERGLKVWAKHQERGKSRYPTIFWVAIKFWVFVGGFSALVHL